MIVPFAVNGDPVTVNMVGNETPTLVNPDPPLPKVCTVEPLKYLITPPSYQICPATGEAGEDKDGNGVVPFEAGFK